MTLSLLKQLRAGPPPPKVLLQPDALFFTRSVPVVNGSSLAEVNAQVELALETLSPFPPSQLYQGYFWAPGADRVLVFAAYRRRFTNEQVAEWDNVELVLPTFAALLGGEVKAPATLIYPSAEGLTAVYWEHGVVPSRVVSRAIVAEDDALENERARVRDELLKAAPANRQIVLSAPPTVEAGRNEREYAFRAESFLSRMPVTQALTLDVRDKDALAALRRARSRDVGLWRGFVGLVVALLLLGVGELALIGGGFWQKNLTRKVELQRPVVEKIEAAQGVTARINELSTKRLLPFEMISIVTAPKPTDIWFLRTSTDGLYGLTVDATTTSPGLVSTYQSALAALPAIEKVEIRDQRTRDNTMTFTLAATFRPEALRPTPTP